MIELLLEYGVEFVEQPLPPHDLDGLRFVRERSSLPIDRRRVLRRRDRHSRGSPAWWTGSTSSSRSAAGCARR